MKTLRLLIISLVVVSSGILHLYAETIPEKIQKGLSLLNSGDIQSAAAILEEVIEENPNHGPARLMLGQIAMGQNQWQQAETHLKIAIASGSQRPHLGWQLLARVQLLQHRYAEARTSFDRALQQSQAFAPAMLGRAQSALFLNDPEAALSDLQNLPSMQSSDGALLLAELLIYLNRTDEARKHLSALNGDAAKLLLQAIGNDADAPRAIKSFIAENLGHAESYLAYALAQKKRNQPGSLPLFKIAWHLNDQNPMPLLFLKQSSASEQILPLQTPTPEVIQKVASAGEALKKQDIQKAQQLAEEVLKERPMHIPARLMLVQAAEEQKDYWTALENYQQIANWIPGISSIEARFSAVAQKMGAYDVSECRLRKALENEPDHAHLHYLLATTYQAQKKVDVALAECKRAIDLGFREASAYVTLGNLYYEKMQISDSIGALSKAVELDPRAAETIASFALSALTSQDYAALRTILEKHAQANPANISTLYSLAMMHMNENRLEEASKYLTQLERLAPDHLQVHYNLALVRSRLGQEEEGRKAMARFEELKRKEREEWDRHNRAHKIRLEAGEHFGKKNTAESIRLYSQLAAENLAELEDLLALARSYQLAQRRSEALQWYEKILQSSPYNIDALKGASETAAQTGKSDVAKLYSGRLQLLTRPCN